MLVVTFSDDINTMKFFVFDSAIKKFCNDAKVGWIMAMPLTKFGNEKDKMMCYSMMKDSTVVKKSQQ